ncbi:Wall-associated receptor kinase galacturonan-binding domain-containing protein [Dioscorea alata]|uniref:Wall-associated receptor kinase galacturonan-binding domain-containing protein n=1 Tax=Dioscorea alata TaxID=55571 RepID=A0ACB7UG99_DIOAL|nr:Wall-associated receptor kinase galacturonan-binding domain-containing protein [Dioscorea alata]
MVIFNVPSPAVVPSALLFTIFFLFFFSLFPCNTTLVSAAGDHYCAPSSCGNLTNIRYPFRLKDDPPNCGNPNYELTCDHLNHTLLTLFSHSYYVTNITYYEHYFFDAEVDFKYVGMEKYNNINNNGSCSHLPLPASLTRSQMMSYKYYDAYYGWVTLVNCSKELKDKSMRHYYKVNDSNLDYDYYYKPVPCLSHNNSFIYLIGGGYYGSSYKTNNQRTYSTFWARGSNSIIIIIIPVPAIHTQATSNIA